MMPFTEDVTYFYATIYGGIIIGIVFDFIRCMKFNFKIIRRISLVFDILFWVLTTLIVFVTVNLIESFALRYYHFIALFSGFILYYITVSKLVLPTMNKLVCMITNLVKKTIKYIVIILNNLYYIIVYSIHLLFDTIFYIPNILMAIRRSIKRKSRIRIKTKKGCR